MLLKSCIFFPNISDVFTSMYAYFLSYSRYTVYELFMSTKNKFLPYIILFTKYLAWSTNLMYNASCFHELKKKNLKSEYVHFFFFLNWVKFSLHGSATKIGLPSNKDKNKSNPNYIIPPRNICLNQALRKKKVC